MDTVRARLRQLIERYWQVPAPEAKALLTVLVKSDCSRAKMLRYHLALMDVVVRTAHGAQEPDAAYVFRRVITPRFVLALVNDLRATGVLSVPQTRVIEKAMLQAVDRHGQWRAIEE